MNTLINDLSTKVKTSTLESALNEIYESGEYESVFLRFLVLNPESFELLPNCDIGLAPLTKGDPTLRIKMNPNCIGGYWISDGYIRIKCAFNGKRSEVLIPVDYVIALEPFQSNDEIPTTFHYNARVLKSDMTTESHNHPTKPLAKGRPQLTLVK